MMEKQQRTYGIIIVMLVTGVLCSVLCAGTEARTEAAVRINVTDEDYEANPADEESDTYELQLALDQAMEAEEGIEVYLPAGDYYLDDSLLVYSNTHIILDAKATVHRSIFGVDRCMLYNVDGYGIRDGEGGYEVSHDIIIEGGTWDGGDISDRPDPADLIRIDHAENVTIKNCQIKNAYAGHHINLVAVKNGLIQGCTFSGFRFEEDPEDQSDREFKEPLAKEAVQLESAWTYSEADPDDQDFAWASETVIDGTPCMDIKVTGCVFTDLPYGIGQHHFSRSGKNRNQNIEISNNVLTYQLSDGKGETAVDCCGTDHVRIMGNQIDGSYQGAVHVDGSSDAVIEKNQIQGSQKYGIVVEGGKAEAVQDNALKNIAGQGISCTGGIVKNILRNQITGSGGNGIFVTGGTVRLVRENVIKKTSKNGILVSEGTVGRAKKKSKGLIANTIINCKKNGILAAKKAVISSISDNQIRRAGKNGISVGRRARVVWLAKNVLKKCKKNKLQNLSVRA